jgi:SAM-dependent methyltransferase
MRLIPLSPKTDGRLLGHPSVTDRLLLAIFHRFPARPEDVIFKAPEGRGEVEYADEEGFGFRWHFRRFPDLFVDKDVLDIGSGFGGRPVKYVQYGVRSVTGVEISEELVQASRTFAARMGVTDRVDFLVGTGEEIPLPAESVDLVTMMDVMEHVVSPREVLAEAWRVLRPGGRMALAFPPYYDLTGGSHLHGYATRVPGLNLLFTTRALQSAASQLFAEQQVDYRRYLREVPTDKLWNMNGLTARGFRRLVRQSPFRLEWIQYLGHLQFRRAAAGGGASSPAKRVYAAAQLAAQPPLLREIFCARICALLAK